MATRPWPRRANFEVSCSRPSAGLLSGTGERGREGWDWGRKAVRSPYAMHRRADSCCLKQTGQSRGFTPCSGEPLLRVSVPARAQHVPPSQPHGCRPADDARCTSYSTERALEEVLPALAHASPRAHARCCGASTTRLRVRQPRRARERGARGCHGRRCLRPRTSGTRPAARHLQRP